LQKRYLVTRVVEVRVSSDVDLKTYLEMTDACFKVLFHLLKLHAVKQSTKSRQCGRKVSCNVTILAAGRRFENLKSATVISPQALS
jgi:hypothetical protein